MLNPQLIQRNRMILNKTAIKMFRLILALLFTLVLLGCENKVNIGKPNEDLTAEKLNEYEVEATVKFPKLPSPEVISEKVEIYKILLSVRELGNMTLWIYKPVSVKVPTPVVFIAPAGTNLIEGMKLDVGDMPEHLPYAEEGMIVVAYSLSGYTDKQASKEVYSAATKQFIRSKMGLVNAKIAIDYAFSKLAQIDRERVFAVGHSSAGMLSLQLAIHDPRITHCIAYNPASTYQWNFPDEIRESYIRHYMGLDEAFKAYDPLNHVRELKIPTFIFHAQDDEVVSVEFSNEFVKKLRQTNPHVEYKVASQGGHYQSMIEEGIPTAISWMRKQ